MSRLALILSLWCLVLLLAACRSTQLAPGVDNNPPLPVKNAQGAVIWNYLAGADGPGDPYQSSPVLLDSIEVDAGQILLIELWPGFEDEDFEGPITIRATAPGFQADFHPSSAAPTLALPIFITASGMLTLHAFNSAVWDGPINSSRVVVRHIRDFAPPEPEEPNADNIIGTINDSTLATSVVDDAARCRMHLVSADELDIEEWFRISKPTASTEAEISTYADPTYGRWQFTCQFFHPDTLELLGAPEVIDPADGHHEWSLPELPTTDTLLLQVTGSPLPIIEGGNVAYGDLDLFFTVPWEITAVELGENPPTFEIDDIVEVRTTYTGTDGDSDPQFTWIFNGGATCIEGCNEANPTIQMTKTGYFSATVRVTSVRTEYDYFYFNYSVGCSEDHEFRNSYPPVREWTTLGPPTGAIAISNGSPHVFTVDALGLLIRSDFIPHRPMTTHPGFWQSPTTLVHHDRIYVAFRNATTDTLDLLTCPLAHPDATNDWTHYILDNRVPTSGTIAMAAMPDQLGVAYTVEAPIPGVYLATSRTGKPAAHADWTTHLVDADPDIRAIDLDSDGTRWWMAKQLPASGDILVGKRQSGSGGPEAWQFHEVSENSIVGSGAGVSLLRTDNQFVQVHTYRSNFDNFRRVRLLRSRFSAPYKSSDWEWETLPVIQGLAANGHVATIADGSLFIAVNIGSAHRIFRSCSTDFSTPSSWSVAMLQRASYDTIREPLLAMQGDDQALYTLSLRDPDSAPKSPHDYVFDRLDLELW